MDSTASNPYDRHGALVDKKFETGLTPEEEAELAAIRQQLDEQEAVYYEPVKKKLRAMINGLQKGDSAMIIHDRKTGNIDVPEKLNNQAAKLRLCPDPASGDLVIVQMIGARGGYWGTLSVSLEELKNAIAIMEATDQ